MSDRGSNTARAPRPTVASARGARTPLTPRIAATRAKTPSTVQSEPPKLTPKVKQNETPGSNTLGNITPRSSARKIRVDSSQSTPTQTDEPSSLPRPTSALSLAHPREERGGSISALGFTSARAGRPKSVISDVGSSRGRSPVLSPTKRFEYGQKSPERTIESRFFHASDVPEAKPLATKKIEIKKAPTFMYADGQHEAQRSTSRSTSPVLSAVSEQRSSGPWIRAESTSNPSKSPPMLSPALSSISMSNTSPFFAAATGHRQPRSPSPSKENIHLSYRKGASQIFGTRPQPKQTDTGGTVSVLSGERRGSSILNPQQSPHRKSGSLSSIDSGNSTQSRRRSATTIDVTPSPLNQEIKSATIPRVAKAVPPSIDTSADPLGFSAPPSAFSPTKSISDLASDARRERKVLDLEISNSSLLAINASLEREVRRQKAELKRFRRLSRAGRFSVGPVERTARFSEGLSVVGEGEDEDSAAGYFGPPSGFTDLYDDFSASSEDEDDDGSESITSGSDPLSPRQASRESERLDRDEKRLKLDLAKHKELLVQSQMMNQSLKRCMLTTEDMIKEGRKALDYHVRISDVKLGGRILTGHEDEDDEDDRVCGEETLVVEDDLLRGEGSDEVAEDFMKVWQGVGRLGFEGGAAGSDGDRDSGIEVERQAIGALIRRIDFRDRRNLYIALTAPAVLYYTSRVLATVFLPRSLAAPSILASPRQALQLLDKAQDLDTLPYPPDALPGARDVDTPYGNIRVYEWGPEDGRKVLFVHGISTPCIALATMAKLLVEKEGCRVMLFDLFGRGYSDAPDPEQYPQDERLFTSEILLVLASSLNWVDASERFALVGYSLGGGIAAAFTSYFPDLVGSLILIAPSGLLRPKHISFTSKLLYGNLLPQWLVKYYVANRLKGQPPVPFAQGHKGGNPEATVDPATAAESEVPVNGHPALAANSEAALFADRPGISPANTVAWQLDAHSGFVASFVSSIRHAPITNQHARWRLIGTRQTAQRNSGASNTQGLKEEKVLILLGEQDSIIVADEVEEDATEVLGVENVKCVRLEGGHDVPIVNARGCVDAMSAFFGGS
ncbi:hypothetical protein LTR22_011493 [Elasticomyces elasticus]|nr:hypothetical protein LTR22_011493 [Elasticomyces elasticus]KAK4915909.1 hypothetical protein LTR49_016055 [Elasticomyces elasticus]KAK5755355.1 hypothetical protein LTS12_014584 [Elasticomyces elasticus]